MNVILTIYVQLYDLDFKMQSILLITLVILKVSHKIIVAVDYWMKLLAFLFKYFY